jgi:hypothetical protein
MTRAAAHQGSAAAAHSRPFRSHSPCPRPQAPFLHLYILILGDGSVSVRRKPYRPRLVRDPEGIKINSGREPPRGATHCERAVEVHLVSRSGPVTGPLTRSPYSWPWARASIPVVSGRLPARIEAISHGRRGPRTTIPRSPVACRPGSRPSRMGDADRVRRSRGLPSHAGQDRGHLAWATRTAYDDPEGLPSPAGQDRGHLAWATRTAYDDPVVSGRLRPGSRPSRMGDADRVRRPGWSLSRSPTSSMPRFAITARRGAARTAARRRRPGRRVPPARARTQAAARAAPRR